MINTEMYRADSEVSYENTQHHSETPKMTWDLDLQRIYDVELLASEGEYSTMFATQIIQNFGNIAT